jgi:Ser/Thr protein kinase RdoA (MazF antagonist)
MVAGMDALGLSGLSVHAVEVQPDAQAVAAAWRLGAPLSIEPVDAGQSPDLLWRLTTSRGVFAVKQFAPTRGDRDARLAENMRFQRKAWEAGVAMPEPLLDSTGHGLRHIPCQAGGTRPVTVHRWVDGAKVAYDEPLEVRIPAAIEMARTMARLHTLVRVRHADPEPWYREPVGMDRWGRLADLAEMSGVSWGPRLRAVLPQLAFADAVVADPRRGPDDAMGHGDANPHNVLHRPGGGIAMVDWDGARPFNATEELTAVISGWARDEHGRPDDDLARAMVRAYRDAGGHYEPDGLHVFAMKFASAEKWLLLCVEVALGVRQHERVTPQSAMPQVEGMLDWAEHVEEARHLLEVLRSV